MQASRQIRPSRHGEPINHLEVMPFNDGCAFDNDSFDDMVRIVGCFVNELLAGHWIVGLGLVIYGMFIAMCLVTVHLFTAFLGILGFVTLFLLKYKAKTDD